MIQHENETEITEICPADDCTGCFACKNICPKDAIETQTDMFGRTLPEIDPEKCIRCGACQRVCPVQHPVTVEKPKQCFAAQRKSAEARNGSASGGIGAALAECILAGGGVVYGAAVQPGGKVEHIRADSLVSAQRLKNSKYVQSDIGLSYRSVRKDLKDGKTVLFTGTPCQIAGLRNYLGKDEARLYCVDIVCHGVPPMRFLEAHFASVIPDTQIASYTFRGGSPDFRLTVSDGERTVYDKFRRLDPYYITFFNGTSYRENCYHCVYAKPSRCSDLTIGDFWGLDRSSLQSEMQGNISVVLPNTPKGAELLKMVSGDLISEERELEEAVNGNDQLRAPSEKSAWRDLFIRSLANGEDIEKSMLAAGGQKDIDAYLASQTFAGKAKRKVKKILSRFM
ncbi:MAG: Coenzyme F420 hydrogenase/dehydrogenase, beta subunit C-terminal domain [Clostridia bacterium]|nr:Coenzyme F420 hydrogenase/dehydrogenase, beta subunit C-terminal domain [Clostridia bacterium]